MPAVGTILTIGTLAGTSIGSSNVMVATAGTAVVAGDLVVCCLAEQTTLTVTSASDNLGNTYSAQNAGTDAGATTGRLFFSRVSIAGNLSSVSMAATSSGNNFACNFVALAGPIDVASTDSNPANTTGDTASPYITTSSGALVQPIEIVVGWSANNVNTTAWAGTSGTTMGSQAATTAIHSAIGFKVTAATTAVTIDFTGSAPTVNAMGILSFKVTNLMAQGCL